MSQLTQNVPNILLMEPIAICDKHSVGLSHRMVTPYPMPSYVNDDKETSPILFTIPKYVCALLTQENVL